jgi:anti-sigma factor RsiW
LKYRDRCFESLGAIAPELFGENNYKLFAKKVMAGPTAVSGAASGKSMDCNETRRLLDAYVDGELELTRQLDVEAHLAGCPTCKKAVEAAINFRFSIRANMPVYKAPPELQRKIRAVLRKESGSWLERVFRFWRYLAGTAGILVLGFSFAWAWIVDSHDKDRELIAEAISDHSRSLLADHLLDVTSSDQHTVEPWITSKLDYIPPVANLSEAGY